MLKNPQALAGTRLPHFQTVMFMTRLVTVKRNCLESHFETYVDSEASVYREEGTCSVGSPGVTLGCAANSAATFHLHTRVNTHTVLCTLSFSHTLQKPAFLGVKWLLPWPSHCAVISFFSPAAPAACQSESALSYVFLKGLINTKISSHCIESALWKGLVFLLSFKYAPLYVHLLYIRDKAASSISVTPHV